MARVAVTGAAGRIGSRILPELSDHSVTAIDVESVDDPGLDEFESIELDVVEARGSLEDAFSNCETVIHLAARSSASERWERVVGPNIDGTYNAYEAASNADVDRVIFASSNHAVHMRNVEDPAVPNSMRTSPEAVVATDSVAPTGAYGISKVTGEAIGSHFASRYGIEVVNFRIGSFLTEERLIAIQEESDAVARYHRGMYLSVRDAIDAFRCAIDAALPENPLTVNVTSRNEERTLPITRTMRALGYDPKDDSKEVLEKGNG